jgi:hypothetical protein
MPIIFSAKARGIVDSKPKIPAIKKIHFAIFKCLFFPNDMFNGYSG